MPINILGMIGVAPPAGGATVRVIGGGIGTMRAASRRCMKRQDSMPCWWATLLLADAEEFGKELIPRIRALVAERDGSAKHT